MKLFNIVYKTINTLNGLYYIGVHSTDDLNDGYLGSGLLLLKAIKKYGKNFFYREILFFAKTREEAYSLEASLVTPELIRTRKCYNRAPGGQGGYLGPEAIEKMRKSKLGVSPWNKGKGQINTCKCGKRIENLKASKCRSCYVGTQIGSKNPAAKYIYLTPKGTFESPYMASETNGVPVTTLVRWCKTNKHNFSIQSLKQI